MIKLDFHEPSGDEAWKRWRRVCDRAMAKMQDVVAKGGVPQVGNLYKRKTIKDRFYFAEDGLFGGKCAYCESYLKHFHNPDIDHYRPKAGVTDENDAPVVVDYGKGPEPHRGYYWKGYSVDNLLPACEICNQPSTIATEKVGKHMRFPVDGAYARSDADIAAERPMILNPFVDHPELEIEVDLNDGTLNPRGGSKRAEVTIKVFGLNVRDQLRERRLGKIREVRALLTELLHNPTRRSDVLRELHAMKRGRGEYTIVVRAVLHDVAPLFAGLE
jgi:hypothetical protein